jgi:hypothetical protein
VERGVGQEYCRKGLDKGGPAGFGRGGLLAGWLRGLGLSGASWEGSIGSGGVGVGSWVARLLWAGELSVE